ncbi:MAG: catalase [Mycobacterium sp.]|nr:catalase [Mycobacterium sp.]
MPPKRHADQAAPAPLSPTGAAEAAPLLGADPRAQQGDYLTTAQGVRVDNTDLSLKAGRRGPSLIEDFHLREKITHFDHERIPERVVHARGAAAHGTFTAYGNAASVTFAPFLAEKGRETPVFVRFSTVLGSRGSADTVRDIRGFATKFYTAEGTMDLVGNNTPIFFIQDGIKFPDLIHAAKPRPDREIPQAQTAHDNFWDFVSLHTESMHQVIWAMSDRAIPRSFRTMEGFGIHTFRLVDAEGGTALVKFHWKPAAGVHGLVWEEAQLLAGMDPDFHRRDLYDGIGAGSPLEWELGIQVFPDTPDESFEGIDLLDPTKIVPEELAPVQRIGKLVLDKNPTNFFAEVEQVAFCTQHVVPGVQFTNDPLLQARNFSYLDTQLSRLGGPNFTQLPINRPHAPVNDNHRDGMHQTAIHQGIAPYLPNSLDEGLPKTAPAEDGAYVTVPTPVEGVKERAKPVSFDDHFTQATLFWRSMTPTEQAHIVEAYSFELSKCSVVEIRERMLGHLANIDADLCERVAANLGLPAPSGSPATDVTPSRALSMITNVPSPVAGRVVGVVAVPGADLAGVAVLRKALNAEGVILRVIAPTAGEVATGTSTELVERALPATRSVEFDAVLLANGTGQLRDEKLTILLQEALRHLKPIAAWGDGAQALAAAGITPELSGVAVADTANGAFSSLVLSALRMHRVWDRAEQLPSRVTPGL